MPELYYKEALKLGQREAKAAAAKGDPATLPALVYKPIFYPVFKKNTYSKKFIPTVEESDIWHHVLYLLIIIAIYFLFYIAFDGLAKTTLLVSLLRYLINIAVNLALAVVVDVTLFNKSR